MEAARTSRAASVYLAYLDLSEIGPPCMSDLAYVITIHVKGRIRRPAKSAWLAQPSARLSVRWCHNALSINGIAIASVNSCMP